MIYKISKHKYYSDAASSSYRYDVIKTASNITRNARILSGLTQKEFSKKVGISVATISNLENARFFQVPTLETLDKIARGANKKLKISLGD